LEDVNTFPTRNQLPDPKSGFADYRLIFGFSIINYGDNSTLFFKNLFSFRVIVTPIATDDDFTRRLLGSQVKLIK